MEQVILKDACCAVVVSAAKIESSVISLQCVSAQRKAANQDSTHLGLPAIIDVIWPFYMQIKALRIEPVFIKVSFPVHFQF